MSKFKQRLIKGLSTFLLAGAFLFPKAQAQERVIRDAFPNPNSTELAIEHNYDELNSLEKILYLEDKLEEDTSKIYIDKIPGAMCGNYVGQMWINFDGDSTLNLAEIPFDYYDTENGKQNIQTFDVGFGVLFHRDSLAHGVNSFVLEDSLENISSFYIYDNSRGKRIYLDSLEKNIDLDYQINPNVPVTISHIDRLGVFPHTEFMLRFEYINGVLTLTEKDPSAVLTNPELDKEKSITEYSFRDTITNNPDALVLNYNFYDGEYLETKNYYFGAELQPYDFYSGHFLDSGFFQIDTQDKFNFDFSRQRGLIKIPIYNQSGEIPLDKSEGKHQVIVNITEYAENTTKDTINYLIDKTPPTTSDNVPVGWQNFNFNVTLTPSDALSGVASTKYCVSLTDDCTPNIEYSGPVLISEEGEKYFRHSSTDSAGNNQPVVSKELKLDKTPSEIQIHYPENKDYDSLINKIIYTITDANLDSCFYSVDDGETKQYFPCTSGKQDTLDLSSVQGENIWTLYAGDDATNLSSEGVTFNVDTTNSVEEPTLEDYFKFYPNPVTDIGNFEFSLDKPQNLRFSISDITGRQLEQRVIEGNLGENKIPYDFSKYSSGIYIYRFEGLEGNIKTGKIVKR